MGDDKDNQQGVGFSGISSLLPDDPPEAAAQQSTPETGGSGSRQGAKQPSTSATASSTPLAPPPAPKSKQPAPRRRSGGRAIWVWTGIAVVIFVIWAASQSGSQPDQFAYQLPVAQPDSRTPPFTPGQRAQTTTATATTSSPDGTGPLAGLYRDQANNTVATTSKPHKLAVQKPPIGSGNVFSVAEIRYCLALKQRVEGAQPVVDTYSRDQVDRFNAMVDDYNARCHYFRYYGGDLNQAQRDVAPYAQQFQAEGRRLVRGNAHSPTARQATESDATRSMISNAQRALNALGYNAGTPDGIVGPKTRASIVSFQRSAGMEPDGRVTDRLLASLNSAKGHAEQSRRVVISTQPTATTRSASVSPLTFDEKTSIEVACASAVGAANHNRCRVQQLQQLANGPREPNMSGLTYDEKTSVDVACASAVGAASHNRCLVQQLQQLANGPPEPDMTGLTYDEKTSIEVACTSAVGAANHNRCLIRQLGALGR